MECAQAQRELDTRSPELKGKPALSYLLRRRRHPERMRAVGTHYGPTRILGPTGYAIGGAMLYSRHCLRCKTDSSKLDTAGVTLLSLFGYANAP